MTKLTPAQAKFLKAVAHSGKLICESYKRTTDKVAQAGYAVKVNGRWQITPAGLAYLYQDAPMVDQPQPAPEVTKRQPRNIGDTVHFMIDRELVGTITDVWAGGYHVQIEGQTFQHRIPFGCVIPNALWGKL